MHHDRGSTGGGLIAGFLAGVAATVALGGYLLYGPQGARNRKKLDRFMLRAKAEILEKMQEAGDVTEEQYGKIVDAVADRYADMKDAGAETADRIAARFRRRWRDMRSAAARAQNRAERDIEDEDLEDEF